jgi:hypothetical protein
MSPGTYMRKRREAAGLSVREASLLAVSLPLAAYHRPGHEFDIQEAVGLMARFGWIEGDRDYLTESQAWLLQRVMPFDPDVYIALTLLHAIGPERAAWSGLPVPQVCRECACSWHVACLTSPAPGVAARPCSWSAEPDLCTACERTALAVAAVPQPSSVPARVQVSA